MGQNSSKTSDGNETTRLPLGWLIALVIVQAMSLGLKAWEERQSADIAALALLQSTAQAASERITGQITAVTAVLEASAPSQSNATKANALPGIDHIATLREASSAPAGSRLRLAADVALRIDDSDTSLFTVSSGDVAVIHRTQDGIKMLALGPASAWFPEAASDWAFAFTGPDGLSNGNTELASLPLNGAYGGSAFFRQSEGFPRAAVGCAQPTGAIAALCAIAPRPLFGQADALRIVIYGLLFLAPALAIYGLYSSLSGKARRIKYALKVEKDSAQIFDLVMEGADAGYWETQIADKKIVISERFGHLLGIEDARIYSWDDFLDDVYEEDRDAVLVALERCQVLGLISVIFRTSRSAGSRWIELTGKQIQNPDSKGMRCAGIAADVSKRKRNESKLQDAERRLRNALEGYDGPFAIWDHRKRLLYWNSAYARCFNLTNELRNGMGHDTVALARAPAIRQETPSKTQPNSQLLQLTSGQWISFVERPTPEGGLISVGVDVTETTQNANQADRHSKKLKQTLIELERSEAHAAELARKYSEEKDKAERAAHSKSTFLANMSHELRTPLNAINGFSEILVKELYGPLGDERYKGYATDILSSGQHLLDMINDILDMAKIEAGRMDISCDMIDPVDPVDAAIRMIGRKAEDEQIRLIFDAEEDLPKISADHRAIRQMMLNLVSNAIKFTDPGGKISVTVRKRDDYIRIAVTDTGVGIPEHALPRLANPFEQVADTSDRNSDGTGLGLALTKSFAEMHGGKLTLSSQEGRGTTAAIYLPVKERAPVLA
ncbi:MAG: PAS domain-containing sensor histidine kinase [Pseudomonadota bacterium]